VFFSIDWFAWWNSWHRMFPHVSWCSGIKEIEVGHEMNSSLKASKVKSVLASMKQSVVLKILSRTLFIELIMAFRNRS
jgi:hypothetical protein